MLVNLGSLRLKLKIYHKDTKDTKYEVFICDRISDKHTFFKYIILRETV